MSKFSKGHIKAARLTPQQVLEIRERYAAGATQGSLSRDFNISVVQIGRIVRGEAWQQFRQPISDDQIAEAEALSHEAPPIEFTPEMHRDISKAIAEELAAKNSIPAEPLVPQDGMTAMDRFLARGRALQEKVDEFSETSSPSPSEGEGK